MLSLSDYANYDGLGLAGLVARKDVTPRELVETAVKAIESGQSAGEWRPSGLG